MLQCCYILNLQLPESSVASFSSLFSRVTHSFTVVPHSHSHGVIHVHDRNLFQSKKKKSSSFPDAQSSDTSSGRIPCLNYKFSYIGAVLEETYQDECVDGWWQ